MRGMTTWRGEEDIELISRMFMDFLTTPTAATAIALEMKTPPKGEEINIPSKMLNKDVEADDGLDKEIANARAILKENIESMNRDSQMNGSQRDSVTNSRL